MRRLAADLSAAADAALAALQRERGLRALRSQCAPSKSGHGR